MTFNYKIISGIHKVTNIPKEICVDSLGRLKINMAGETLEEIAELLCSGEVTTVVERITSNVTITEAKEIRIKNTGLADATVLGTTLKPGESISFKAQGKQTIAPVEIDATGTELLVSSTTEAAPAPEGDPFFDYVSLLIPGNGTDGGTTITEITGKTVNNTNVITTTEKSKFNGSSLYFDNGSSLDYDFDNPIYSYLIAAPSTDYNFGTGDFTVEMWVCMVDEIEPNILFSASGSGFNDGWDLSIGSGVLSFGIPGAAYLLTGFDNPMASGVWHHVAATRESGTLRIFVNGIEAAEENNFDTNRSLTSATGVGIGTNPDIPEATPFKGNLAEIRITKGVARYTADFTPPNAPFPTN
jgi:hypothetical protein